MDVFTILLIMASPCLIGGLNCDREFNYYDQYGKNGFDVICKGITKGYEKLLKSITVFNEVTLTIKDSVFENVTQDIFTKVKDIKYLNIVNSTFTFPRGHEIFAKLGQLEHLDIEATKFDISNSTFKGLNKLLQMTLNNTNTSVVVKNAFTPLKKLRELTIVNNNIASLSDIPICELKKLNKLNLEKNIISNIKYNFFVCKKRNPGKLDVSLNEDVQEIGVHDTFYDVDDNSFMLLDINLSHNRIENIGSDLGELSTLKNINLEGNLIKQLQNGTFTRLKALVSVVLRNNSIGSIGDNFNNKLNLKVLNMEHNKLQDVKIENIPNLRYLNLASNNISSVSVMFANQLDTLILKNNKLTKVEEQFFKYMGNLVHLDISDNNITFTSNTFLGLDNLNQLYIGGNNISVLPGSIFHPLKNLKVLDVSRNNLNALKPNTIFQSLSRLEQLNISYNKIETIDYLLLESMVNLKVLDLSGNRIQNIQYDLIISKLPSISVLNIRYNLLSCKILVEIIGFLKKKNIDYTATEHFDYTKENVAGIYCSNDAKNIAKMNPKHNGESSVLFNFVILLVIVLVSIVIAVLLFKIYVYLKRRKYRADEFELVTD